VAQCRPIPQGAAAKVVISESADNCLILASTAVRPTRNVPLEADPEHWPPRCGFGCCRSPLQLLYTYVLSCTRAVSRNHSPWQVPNRRDVAYYPDTPPCCGGLGHAPIQRVRRLSRLPRIAPPGVWGSISTAAVPEMALACIMELLRTRYLTMYTSAGVFSASAVTLQGFGQCNAP
jgi:hypothetical protein